MNRVRQFGLCAAQLLVLGAPAIAQTDDAGFTSDVVCLIEPYDEVEVSTSVPGVLAEVNVDRGEFVQLGQTLAQLESRVQEAELIVARARVDSDDEIRDRQTRLDFARRKRERADDLFDKKMISDEEKDQLDTDLVLAQSQLNIAQSNKRVAVLELQRAIEALKLRTIVSPIDGIVVERYLSAGESAEDRPILKLAQLDPLHVELVMPVANLGSVKPGMRAEVMPEEADGDVLVADVVVVDRVVDAASGTLGVRLRLPNPGNRIRAGTKCRLGAFLPGGGGSRKAASDRASNAVTVLDLADDSVDSSEDNAVLPPPGDKVTHSDGWLTKLDPEHYTVQLMSSSDEREAQRYLGKVAQLGGDARYIRYQSADGAIRHAVIYGVYPGYSRAETARARLPEGLRRNVPWTRRIGDLQGKALP